MKKSTLFILIILSIIISVVLTFSIQNNKTQSTVTPPAESTLPPPAAGNNDIKYEVHDGITIVIDPNGFGQGYTAKYPVDQIVLNLTNSGTRSDAERFSALVNGNIIGFVPDTNNYLLRVSVTNKEELFVLINRLRDLNDSVIERVLPNYLLEPIREPNVK